MNDVTPRQVPGVRAVSREQAVDGIAGAMRTGAVVLIAPDGAVPRCARLLAETEAYLGHWTAVLDKPGVKLLTLTNDALAIAQVPEPVSALVLLQRHDAERLLAYAGVPGPEPGERCRIFYDEVDAVTGVAPRYPDLYLDALGQVDAEAASKLRDAM
jgi:hypothetical protein